MQYRLLNITEDLDVYKTQLLHPYLLSHIYENLESSKGFRDFIFKNDVATWFIFSDYCLDDKNKPNNVITFTVIALNKSKDFELIKNILSILQPKDLKHSKKINPAFLNFISLIPVFNISYILPNNRNIIRAFNFEELSFLKMRYSSLENYYRRLQAFPLIDLKFTKVIKDLKLIQNKFDSKSVSLGIYRDIEIVNCVVSSICMMISSKLNGLKKFIWVSDRDSILNFEKAKLSSPLIFSIINATFNSLIKTDNKLSFYNHLENNKPELDCFNRIPDIVAGTLADMNKHTVSKEKYIHILRDYLTDDSLNHIAKLHLNNDKYGITTISLYKD